MSRIRTATWIAVLAWAASAGIAEAQVGAGSSGGGSTSTTVTTSAATITPYRVADFLNSIGVNVQLTFGGDNWDDTTGASNASGVAWGSPKAKIAYELNYGGFRHVREGGLKGRTDVITDLNYFFTTYGITADIVQEVNNGAVDTADDMTMIRTATPGAIESYEGTNEWPQDYTSLTYNGSTTYSNGTSSGASSTVNYAWGPLDNLVSMAALRSNVETAITPYVAAAPASISYYPWTEPYVDVVNWHVYANEGIQLSPNVTSAIPLARASSPNAKRVFITETGCTDVNSGGSYGDCMDPLTQEIIALNVYFTSFNVGGTGTQTFFYELMNDSTDSGTLYLEDNFGLFKGDGTPKAAATGLHNLNAILADTGSNAVSAKQIAVPFVVSGLPTGASSMILQKSSGAFDVIVWNGNVSLYNTSTNADITPTASTVSIALGSTYTTAKVYDPVSGTSAISTASSVSSVSGSFSKDPLIFEITP